jgi:hypothetical protein
MFFEIIMSFQKKKLYLYVFPISYKYKYVLFHFNMLKLFQEINMFFPFDSELVSNKSFSLKYLIQGFNPNLLSWFNDYPP